MRHAYLHSHTSELTQPWCEPSPWGDETCSLTFPYKWTHPTLVWAITLRWWDMLTYIPTQENSPSPWCKPSPWGDETCSLTFPHRRTHPALGVSHHLEVMRHAYLHSHTGELTQPLVWAITLRWWDMLTYIPTQENSPSPWCEPSPWGDETCLLTFPHRRTHPALGVSHHLEVMRHAHLHSHTG